ncbi:MAG: hypothetical protein K0R90_1125 [Oscillospiraceae bacterium]|nr:hypothetical protein [Oscillospiraceae bacterium]
MAEKKPKFFEYKGKPLVRHKDTIYYGDMSDDYVVMMKITNTKKEYDMDMADKVTIQMIATDPAINPKDMVIKKSEKTGLYAALEIADIWLSRALSDHTS